MCSEHISDCWARLHRRRRSDVVDVDDGCSSSSSLRAVYKMPAHELCVCLCVSCKHAATGDASRVSVCTINECDESSGHSALCHMTTVYSAIPIAYTNSERQYNIMESDDTTKCFYFARVCVGRFRCANIGLATNTPHSLIFTVHVRHYSTTRRYTATAISNR